MVQKTETMDAVVVRDLLDVWLSETKDFKSTVQMSEHWAAKEIISQGHPMLRMLFAELAKDDAPPLVVILVSKIIGPHSPLFPLEAVPLMANQWLRWAREKRFIL
jgi:hypothetical protein